MRGAKFTPAQIAAILDDRKSGLTVTEVCRRHGVSVGTFYGWQQKYAAASRVDAPVFRSGALGGKTKNWVIGITASR
ncbi:transposase [Variovorax sp. efr-133-TYG-130]|uniref:IS66 family insertion sequence element accessory protein TnpA n=1 Tax=Variovorax sp. efr-133-TYG-130 TaxID=3040327 RepID=UPI00330592C9